MYLADESAIARELGLASPDLETPPADRLVPLRGLGMAAARRAFRRVADGLTATSLAVELPRGSRLIHLYAVVGVSATGVEAPLSDDANAYLATAAPRLRTPEIPVLAARERDGGVRLNVEVAEPVVAVDRVELFRVLERANAGTLEAAGPPLLVLPAAAGERAGEVVRWAVDDPAGVPAWQPVFYRAVAWAASDRDRGEVGGRSAPTSAVEVVVAASASPTLTDLTVEGLQGEPGTRLASFLTAAPRARTYRGVHAVTVTVVRPGPAVSTRRAAADTLPLHVGTLPPAGDLPEDAVFLHHPTDPGQARVCTRVADDTIAVVAEVADPAGRPARMSWSPPP